MVKYIGCFHSIAYYEFPLRAVFFGGKQVGWMGLDSLTGLIKLHIIRMDYWIPYWTLFLAATAAAALKFHKSHFPSISTVQRHFLGNSIEELSLLDLTVEYRDG